MNCFVILAGGMGSRMKSTTPKVLHKIKDREMLLTLLDKLPLVSETDWDVIVVVSADTHDRIKNACENGLPSCILDRLTYCVQEVPNGTGHALAVCIPTLMGRDPDTKIIVLQADSPLIKPLTIREMTKFDHAKMMAMDKKTPNSYGRVIHDIENDRVTIKEATDCSIQESQIERVNCGVYSYRLKYLTDNVCKIGSDNAQGEQYITDLIELIQTNNNVRVEIYDLPKEKMDELLNINDKDTLAIANKL